MGLDFKDYYAILGVPRDATDEDIKRAFRKLARQHHPDVARDKRTGEEKFKEINEAYEVLGNPDRRRKYDALGAGWDRTGDSAPPPGRRRRAGGPVPPEEFHFGGTGFSDFFERFFGQRAGGFGQHFGGFTEEEDGGFAEAAGHGRPGENLEGDILVTIEEAMRGSVRTVSLRRRRRGSDEIEAQEFKVRIPAGVQDGQVIRVPGKGGEGLGGGPAGHLYLHVRLAAHPDFRASGADLYHDLDLAPWEAVLGTEVPVPSPDGIVTVRIPPGTGAGQRLRVRGRGLPQAGGERGDLYVVVNLELPRSVSGEERALWEQLRHVSDFNPRSR